MSIRRLRHRLIFFVFAGLAASGTDAAIFLALTSVSVDSVVSKGLSFLGGSLISYIINRLLTFQDRHANRTLFALGYFLGFLVNTSSYWILHHTFLSNGGTKNWSSWLGATLVSASFNFLYMNKISFGRAKEFPIG